MKKSLMIAAIGTLAITASACDVEQTEQGDMPEVEVKGGNLPEYDVDTADVDVRTEERTVEVPTIDVEEADAGKAN
jgi:hypothetical protein